MTIAMTNPLTIAWIGKDLYVMLYQPINMKYFVFFLTKASFQLYLTAHISHLI